MLRLKTFVVGYYQTNCYVINDDSTDKGIVIDPGDGVGAIKEYIALKKLDIVAILLTHGHFDHVLGVNELKASCPNSKVYYHKEAEKMLLNDKKKYQVLNLEFDNIEADFYVKDGDKLELANMGIEVMYTPGHSDGSVCYIINNDYIFCGDVIFRNSYGATHFYGGNLALLTKSIKKLFDLEGDKILYCGHMESTTLDYERKNNPINEFLKNE